MFNKNLFACCLPFACFGSGKTKKKDVTTQVANEDFFDGNMHNNPFANMTSNPYTLENGHFPNPFLDFEYVGGTKNPFLEKHQEMRLMKNGDTWTPLISSNPFFDECLADVNICIINRTEDTLECVPQNPIDCKSYCEKWVRDHRKYQVKKLRSFSM
ncbi:hypothetical protein HNY73_018064 [Argiope bruennichi]|uniref:Uncharacterized protein n=1 Tax=Argiope bruennichi TaxID=94029 RepID=A0A8T0EFR9_ARGBR|nr:hypothetical protein HNY73_018064 [Argiope bruennichi]